MPFRNIPIRSMLGVPSFTAHYETQKGEGVLFVEDQWLRKSGLCLGSWSTVEMMLNVTFSSSILLPKFSRCNIRELRQRWSGNLVRSEGGR